MIRWWIYDDRTFWRQISSRQLCGTWKLFSNIKKHQKLRQIEHHCFGIKVSVMSNRDSFAIFRISLPHDEVNLQNFFFVPFLAEVFFDATRCPTFCRWKSWFWVTQEIRNFRLVLHFYRFCLHKFVSSYTNATENVENLPRRD